VCTASWLIRSDGFELFFNRDEARSRLEARPPELLVLAGGRCLAPIDGNAGGTWIGVNEHGLAVAILNAWEDTAETELPRVSRGELVMALLSSRSGGELRQRLRGRELHAFRGFRVAAFEAGRDPWIFAWQGGVLSSEEVAMPLVSSSLGAERAHLARREVLRGIAADRDLDAGLLADFHRSHLPERGAWSPCMHRDDASTVSASHVVVGRAEVSIRYAPGPPCRTPWQPIQNLARARSSSSPASSRD